MKIGTRSVLFGVHCFLIHPWFVALGWWCTYGFPFDPRLWVAFFVHDLGYFGKPNMDGDEGELHPYFGAKIMSIFGKKWELFTLYHSRFLAKKNNEQFSKLCIADKMAIVVTPWWLYLPFALLTGEIHEYRKNAEKLNPGSGATYATSNKEWYLSVQKYIKSWIDEHKDGRVDTWTSAKKTANDKTGVWS